jgi:RNase P subunit RPR2
MARPYRRTNRAIEADNARKKAREQAMLYYKASVILRCAECDWQGSLLEAERWKAEHKPHMSRLYCPECDGVDLAPEPKVPGSKP